MIFNEKWDLVLKDELEKDYFKKLGIFVKNEYNMIAEERGNISGR